MALTSKIRVCSKFHLKVRIDFNQLHIIKINLVFLTACLQRNVHDLMDKLSFIIFLGTIGTIIRSTLPKERIYFVFDKVFDF